MTPLPPSLHSYPPLPFYLYYPLLLSTHPSTHELIHASTHPIHPPVGAVPHRHVFRPPLHDPLAHRPLPTRPDRARPEAERLPEPPAPTARGTPGRKGKDTCPVPNVARFHAVGEGTAVYGAAVEEGGRPGTDARERGR